MDPDRLQAIHLFSGLPVEDRRLLAALARESGVQAGATLLTQGELAYELIAIEEGRVAVHRDGRLVAELGRGDVVGELAVLHRGRRTASVIALTPARLITLTGWDLRRLARRAPRVLQRMQDLVHEREQAIAAERD